MVEVQLTNSTRAALSCRVMSSLTRTAILYCLEVVFVRRVRSDIRIVVGIDRNCTWKDMERDVEKTVVERVVEKRMVMDRMKVVGGGY